MTIENAVCIRGRSRRCADVGVRKDDEGIAAAELEHSLLQRMASLFGNLAARELTLDDWFPHLESHRAGVFGPARSKDLRGFSHPLRPPREGDLPPLEERRVCPHEDSVELLAGGLFETFEDLARCGIDGLNAHRLLRTGTVLKNALTAGSA